MSVLLNYRMARDWIVRQPALRQFEGNLLELFRTTNRKGRNVDLHWISSHELASHCHLFDCPFCGRESEVSPEDLARTLESGDLVLCEECTAESVILRNANGIKRSAENAEYASHFADREVRQQVEELVSLADTIEEKVRAKHRRAKAKAS